MITVRLMVLYIKRLYSIRERASTARPCEQWGERTFNRKRPPSERGSGRGSRLPQPAGTRTCGNSCCQKLNLRLAPKLHVDLMVKTPRKILNPLNISVWHPPPPPVTQLLLRLTDTVGVLFLLGGVIMFHLIQCHVEPPLGAITFCLSLSVSCTSAHELWSTPAFSFASVPWGLQVFLHAQLSWGPASALQSGWGLWQGHCNTLILAIAWPRVSQDQLSRIL